MLQTVVYDGGTDAMPNLNFNGATYNINTNSTRQFRNDPVSFLRTTWVNPANYAIMHGYAQWNTISGNAAALKVAGGGGVLAPINNDDLCDVTHFDDQNGTVTVGPVARAGLAVTGGALETRYTLENPHTSFPRIFFLPSRANQISCLRLTSTIANGGPRIVMTTAVNGCSIFVTCDDPTQPLNAGNNVRMYHANGIHAGGTRAEQRRYTRKLLRRFVNVRYFYTHPHLALELTSDHYYNSDITDEQNRKAGKGYTVNNINASGSTFLVFGYMSGNGVWNFHYQWHVDIDYDRTGASRFFRGQNFQGAKHRLRSLHVPQLADWTDYAHGLTGIP